MVSQISAQATDRGGIGVVLARTVEMTAMPELVAVFNGFGGLASTLGEREQRTLRNWGFTGDLNVAEVEWIAQYRVKDPYKFLFKVRNVRSTYNVPPRQTVTVRLRAEGEQAESLGVEIYPGFAAAEILIRAFYAMQQTWTPVLIGLLQVTLNLGVGTLALLSGGGVVCFQPFPSMCDAGLCVEAPSELPPTQAMTMACGRPDSTSNRAPIASPMAVPRSSIRPTSRRSRFLINQSWFRVSGLIR